MQMTSIMKHLLNFKLTNPLDFEHLWLLGLYKQPNSLPRNVLKSWSAFHLSMHELLEFSQALPCKIETFLVVSCPLVHDLVFYFLWLIVNVWMISTSNMERQLSYCIMEVGIIYKLQCAKTINSLSVFCDICPKILLSSLLYMLSLSIGLGVIE